MDLSLKCKKCNKPLELHDMRALPDRKGYICRSCQESVEEKILKAQKAKQKDPKIDIVKGFFEKRSFMCRNCKYRFSRNADNIIKNCPYCGKSNLEERFD
jgi:Zn finger protein HypA/HybF involved in hydrogenase expression